jgi:hypothetical protein
VRGNELTKGTRWVQSITTEASPRTKHVGHMTVPDHRCKQRQMVLAKAPSTYDP